MSFSTPSFELRCTVSELVDAELIWPQDLLRRGSRGTGPRFGRGSLSAFPLSRGSSFGQQVLFCPPAEEPGLDGEWRGALRVRLSSSTTPAHSDNVHNVKPRINRSPVHSSGLPTHQAQLALAAPWAARAQPQRCAAACKRPTRHRRRPASRLLPVGGGFTLLWGPRGNSPRAASSPRRSAEL